MPRLIDKLPPKRADRPTALFDWTPYMDGRAREFDASELPYPNLTTAARCFSSSCFHRGYTGRTRVDSSREVVAVQAVPK